MSVFVYLDGSQAPEMFAWTLLELVQHRIQSTLGLGWEEMKVNFVSPGRGSLRQRCRRRWMVDVADMWVL
jgi:hypothetical protein